MSVHDKSVQPYRPTDREGAGQTRELAIRRCELTFGEMRKARQQLSNEPEYAGNQKMNEAWLTRV